MTPKVEIVHQIIQDLSTTEKVVLFSSLHKKYKKLVEYSQITEGERRCFGSCEFSDITEELEKEKQGR